MTGFRYARVYGSFYLWTELSALVCFKQCPRGKFWVILEVKEVKPNWPRRRRNWKWIHRRGRIAKRKWYSTSEFEILPFPEEMVEWSQNHCIKTGLRNRLSTSRLNVLMTILTLKAQWLTRNGACAMTPLSRKKCFWSCKLQHLKRCGAKINITGCEDYENTFARIESDCTLRFGFKVLM